MVLDGSRAGNPRRPRSLHGAHRSFYDAHVPRPDNISAIDTLIGFRSPADVDRNPANVRPSQRGDTHPADYMYPDIPAAAGPGDDAAAVIADTLSAMNANRVGVGFITLSHPAAVPAARAFPDRFVLATQVAANDVMGAVLRIRDDHVVHGICAVSVFAAGASPQIRLDDARWYPVYATCVELGPAIFVTAGVPGPRVPMDAQHVEAIDRGMYDFPELVMVMRHGAEPWVALAVKLMSKWPGLHYSTSAFAPKHYPQAIVDYANTRGTGKVLYGGYHPYALELDRIFAELDEVPFRDHVWEPFLRDNAARILGSANSTANSVPARRVSRRRPEGSRPDRGERTPCARSRRRRAWMTTSRSSPTPTTGSPHRRGPRTGSRDERGIGPRHFEDAEVGDELPSRIGHDLRQRVPRFFRPDELNMSDVQQRVHWDAEWARRTNRRSTTTDGCARRGSSISAPAGRATTRGCGSPTSAPPVHLRRRHPLDAGSSGGQRVEWRPRRWPTICRRSGSRCGGRTSAAK